MIYRKLMRLSSTRKTQEGKKSGPTRPETMGFSRAWRYYCTGRSDHQIKMLRLQDRAGRIEENLVALEED